MKFLNPGFKSEKKFDEILTNYLILNITSFHKELKGRHMKEQFGKIIQ